MSVRPLQQLGSWNTETFECAQGPLQCTSGHPKFGSLHLGFGSLLSQQKLRHLVLVDPSGLGALDLCYTLGNLPGQQEGGPSVDSSSTNVPEVQCVTQHMSTRQRTALSVFCSPRLVSALQFCGRLPNQPGTGTALDSVFQLSSHRSEQCHATPPGQMSLLEAHFQCTSSRYHTQPCQQGVGLLVGSSLSNLPHAQCAVQHHANHEVLSVAWDPQESATTHAEDTSGLVTSHARGQQSSKDDPPPAVSRKPENNPCVTPSNQPPDHGEAILFSFISGWRRVPRNPCRQIAQILKDEWGVSAQDCVILVNGRHVSHNMMTNALPRGIPVRITSRLKGGGQQHLKKLRELLCSKGVPHQEEVASRASEVVAAIGEGSLPEVFNCFDSWQALKSKCQGKMRIIKQSEMRPARQKRRDDEEDTLQTQDPWAEALQHRQLRPEASFFMTTAGDNPPILQTVTRGCTGLAVVDENEGQLLAKAEADMSHDELSVIVLGEPSLAEARRPSRVIEFPALDAQGNRLLIKGTLIDLGASPMRVVGEESKLEMRVISSSCIACEVHRAEYEEWPDFISVPHPCVTSNASSIWLQTIYCTRGLANPSGRVRLYQQPKPQMPPSSCSVSSRHPRNRS